MKVCQIIEPTIGGSVRVALDLAACFAEQAHDVCFIYSSISPSPAFLQEASTTKKVKFIGIPITNTIGLCDLFSLIRLLVVLVKHGPFDVLHAHSSKAGGIARLARVFFPRMAVVYSPHAFYTMSHHNNRLFGWVERVLSAVTDRVIAVSAFEKRHGEQLGIDPEKLVVVPNAVVPFEKGTRRQARSMMGKSDWDFVAGFVGRLVEQKNVLRLVRAFALARKQKPDIKLVIIGSGTQKAALEKEIQTHGLNDHVSILEGKDARPYYAGFDVIVCSSDYEGFSLVFLESLQAGTPVVTTPVGGSEEAIVIGKTGYIAATFDEEELAGLIIRMAKRTPLEIDAMSAACLEHIKSFSVDSMCKAVFAVYEQCCFARSR